MTETKRRKGLDYAKGIGIILLIFTHCFSGYDNPLKNWITSFNMPLFFIICGVIICMKYELNIIDNSFINYFKKRFQQLIVPYLFFGIVLITFFQILHFIGGEPYNLTMLLFKLLTFQGIESMWFIPIYLISEFLFIFCFLKIDKYPRALSFFVLINGIILINLYGIAKSELVEKLILIVLSLIFIYVGYLLEKFNIVERIPHLIAILLFILSTVLAIKNGFIGMASLELGNILFTLFNATILNICLIKFCNYLGRLIDLSKLMLIGKNSIVILCTNNLIVEIIRLIDYKLTSNFLLRSGLIGAIIFSLIVIIIEYMVISLFINTRLCFLVGKVRK